MFEKTPLSHWNGLTMMAVDGTLWRTPDTPKNDAAFGSVSETGEADLAAKLIDQTPDHSLTLMDKGFYVLSLLHRWQ